MTRHDKSVPMALGRSILRGALGAILGLGLSGAAIAADDFYKDKQMRVIVPTPAGGLYDLLSRLIAEHMPRHIPGNPRMIVQNMGGAGGLVAANHMANVAPKDGTVIAAAHGSTATASLFSPE